MAPGPSVVVVEATVVVVAGWLVAVLRGVAVVLVRAVVLVVVVVVPRRVVDVGRRVGVVVVAGLWGRRAAPAVQVGLTRAKGLADHVVF